MRDVALSSKLRQTENEPPTTNNSASESYLSWCQKTLIHPCLTHVTFYLVRSSSITVAAATAFKPKPHAAKGLASTEAARLILLRIDQASGLPVIVSGVLSVDQNRYVASIQNRGAYFLAYDRDPPELVQFVAGVSLSAPRTVTLAGSFSDRDISGLNAATFSLQVDGVEKATGVGSQSAINSMNGEFRVAINSGALATGAPARIVLSLADGAGNVSQHMRCAYAVAADILLKPTTATTCAALATGTFNITGSNSPDRSIDVILLTRYLLGFRGTSLTAGLTITGTRTSAADIANFIGDALLFDVLARENLGTPHPMIDALVLLRLAQGMSDDALLSGIRVPNGAGMTTASGIRALVNARFGTTY